MATGAIGTGAGQYEPFDVRISWQLAASRQMTGFSLRKNANLAATADDVLEHVVDNFLEVFRLRLAVDATVLGVDVIKPLTKEGVSYAPTTTLTGGTGNVYMPGFVCAVFSLRSSIRARYGQGRMYVPVTLESYADRETINTAGFTALDPIRAALADNYIDPAGAGEFSLINWHKTLPAGRPSKSPTPLPEVPATWYDVQSIRINPNVTALHSRRQGKGS